MFARKRLVLLMAAILIAASSAILIRERRRSHSTPDTTPVALRNSQQHAAPEEPGIDSSDPAVDTLADEMIRAYREKGGFDPASATIARIAGQVTQLRSESCEQSVRLLSDVEMFYWPGAVRAAGSIEFPMPDDVGQWDLDAVMSNRRFLKVFTELSRMDKEKAASLVAGQIEATLPRYTSMFEETWKTVTRGRLNAPPGAATSAGPSLVVSDNPDHSPTLAGARLQLLALVLVAGNLRLESVRPAVLAIAREGVRQRDMLYREDEGTAADRFLMLKEAGLYSRQILTTGLLGTSATARPGGDAASIDTADRWKTRKLTSYDADATTYDLFTRHGGLMPADFSKGSVEVRFFGPLDDAAFEAVLRQQSVSPALP